MSAASPPYGRGARARPGGLRGRCAAAVDRGAVGTGAPGTSGQPDLHIEMPDVQELLAACCGHLGDHSDDHPITRWARRLAELHLSRRCAPMRAAEIDCRRRELIVAIDHWVSERTTPAHAASVGAAVDALAAAQVRANHLLRSAADAEDERVRTAWAVVAAMAEDWSGSVEQTFGIGRRARRTGR